MFIVACGEQTTVSSRSSASRSNANAAGNANTTGVVRFGVSPNNTLTELQTTLVVPATPPPDGTLFLWPGLQPGGENFAPIDNGVLQPVLSWGPSCAPGSLGNDHSSWWISAEYVNLGNDPGYSGCQGGERIAVNPGDQLSIDIALSDTTWTQTIKAPTGTVNFSKDLQGQAQSYAYFVIEEDGQRPVGDVLFTDTLLRFAQPESDGCGPQIAGARDYVAPGALSADEQTCSLSRIILRADGVPATLPNTTSP